MKIWLNGRRRDVTLSSPARSAVWVVVWIFLLLSTQLPTLLHGDHLDWLFWVSTVAELGLLVSSTMTLIRQLRGGGQIRVYAPIVSDPSQRHGSAPTTRR